VVAPPRIPKRMGPVAIFTETSAAYRQTSPYEGRAGLRGPAVALEGPPASAAKSASTTSLSTNGSLAVVTRHVGREGVRTRSDVVDDPCLGWCGGRGDAARPPARSCPLSGSPAHAVWGRQFLVVGAPTTRPSVATPGVRLTVDVCVDGTEHRGLVSRGEGRPSPRRGKHHGCGRCGLGRTCGGY
jgi:hypothetical protein